MTREESLDIILKAVGGNAPAVNEASQTAQDNASQQSTGTRSRDESLRIIQSALSGGDAAQGGAGSTATQPETTQPPAPSTSSGAVAPPSPQGEGMSTQGTGRSAEQITQSQAQEELDRLKPVLEEAKRLDGELGRYVAGATRDPALYTSTLIQRDSLLKKYGYSSVDELNKAVMDYTLASGNELSFMQKLDRAGYAMGEGLENTVLSGDWWKNIAEGGAKLWSGKQVNAAGTVAGNIESPGKESTSIVYENELRARNDWATTLEEAKTGVIKMDAEGIAEIEKILDYYDNILLPSLRSGVQAYETLAEDSAQAADEITLSGQENVEKAKENLGTGGKFVTDMAVGAVQQVLDKATTVPTLSLATGAFGSGAQKARQEGYSAQKQIAYGTAVAAKEWITEKLSGFGGLYGKGSIDDIVDNTIKKLAKTEAGQTVLRIISGGLGEWTESLLSNFAEPALEGLILSETGPFGEYKNLTKEDLSQWLYDSLVEAALGTVMSGIKEIRLPYVGVNAQTETQAPVQAQTGQGQTVEAEASKPNAGGKPTVEELTRPITQAEDTTSGGNPSVTRSVTSPLTQGSLAGTDLPTAAVTQEAQAQTAETGNRFPRAELYNMRAGKNGWDKTYGTAQEALGEAVQYVDAELWNAIGKEIDNAEGNKQGFLPMTSAMIAVQEEVRQEQITPMQGAKLLSEIYKQGGAEALKTIYNPRTGNLYDKYIGQAKQYVFQKAAETAQEAQRATAGAETPPTTQNAAQAASGELNRQAATMAREQGAGVQREARETEGADTVRGFSENVATDSAMETALREDIAKNPDLYKRLSNKDTLKKAQDIFSQGLDTARSELERAIGAAQSGQKLSPEMVPLSRMVANELTRRGELEAARKIISDVAAELTSAGQLGQAGAILRNADPMTVLNTLQKAIDQINAEMARKFGKRNPWTAELTAEEIKQISETDFSQDGAFEAVQQQIAERLGREMPATLLEKLRELRKVGMLANPKTQVKNVAGNVPLAGERKIAEKLSGGLQELAVKAGIMSKEEQTRTLRVSQESKDLAKSVYENNIDRINRKGNKGELRGLLKDTRTYFNKGLLQKGIEKATGHQLNDAALDYVRRFTYECLEKGDAPFVKSAFIDSLAQYCEAQGIKSEADVTETAISYAIDQAMAATFKDASALANLLNGIKDNAGIAGQALDVLFPFTTTPINIAKEFGKYSPLGYLQLLNAKGKGTAEVIDIISRATTGSAVVAIGALLRGLGFITGAADDDKDKAAADKAAGISPYSFGGKYSYEWMQPTGSALAMGASIYDAAKDGGSLIETISNGIISAGDAYLEQSFYKDIIDLFQGYGSPTENVIRELLTGTASQFIPTIVGATARTIDPTVRTSYSGGNIIDDILAQAKVKTPGISKSAPASVNVRGEEIQRGNLAQRILDNFIFPWTTNRNGGEENAVDEAIDEVYADTADKTIFRQVSPYKVDYGGETYKMTGEEREQFQKTQGQVHDDILQQIIDGTLWQEMDSDAKVKTMQLANEYALDAAKRELVEARGGEYSSDWDDEAELPDVGSYLAAKTTLKAAQDSKDYTLLDALVDTVTEQQKAVQEKLNKDFSMLDELIYGKQHGVDAETIYTAKTEADANGNGKISQEELWYYLGLKKNMPTETKSVLWDILTTGKTGYSDYAEKQK